MLALRRLSNTEMETGRVDLRRLPVGLGDLGRRQVTGA